MNRFLLTLALLGSSLGAFADETTDVATELTGLVTPYITQGKTALLAILGAGVVIVAIYYIWGLIKKGLNRSK